MLFLITWGVHFGPTWVILLSHLKLVCLQQRVKTDSHFSSHTVSSGLRSFHCLTFRSPCVICCCCHCSNSCSKLHCLISHGHLLKSNIKDKVHEIAVGFTECECDCFSGARNQPLVQLQRKLLQLPSNSNYTSLSAALTTARSQYEIGGFPFLLGQETNSSGWTLRNQCWECRRIQN